MVDPVVYRASELRSGLKASFERDVTEEDILAFARLSGDANPLHVDATYARGTNFGARIAHGAFQVGLASAMLGMHLPGRNVLLGSIRSRFPSPLYYPTRVQVIGEISSWSVETHAGQIKVVVQELSTSRPTAEITMGFTLHEEKAPTDATYASGRPMVSDTRDKRGAVLVTGASGGLGSALVEELARTFRVLAVVNAQRPKGLPGDVVEVPVDLRAPDADQQLARALGDCALYGVVHAAWPGAPRGGLLNADTNTVRTQLDFATTIPIMLARLLFERVAPEIGGRFVALGSTAGSLKPYLQWSAYSLAKASLEHTIRLLAPELARKRITVNAVCPSLVPVGINKQLTARQRLAESATVPMGRLCEPSDVCALVRQLLADDAGFVSGQVIALTGGQI